MGQYVGLIVVGVVFVLFGTALVQDGDDIGVYLLVIGGVVTQVGVIAAAVHMATERLHRKLDLMDDAP